MRIQRARVSMPPWSIDGASTPSRPEIRAHATQTSDVDAFDLAIGLEVDLDGEPFFRRDWHERIERRLV